MNCGVTEALRRPRLSLGAGVQTISGSNQIASDPRRFNALLQADQFVVVYFVAVQRFIASRPPRWIHTVNPLQVLCNRAELMLAIRGEGWRIACSNGPGSRSVSVEWPILRQLCILCDSSAAHCAMDCPYGTRWLCRFSPTPRRRVDGAIRTTWLSTMSEG